MKLKVTTILFFCIFILSSCGGDEVIEERRLLSEEERRQEKQNITTVIEEYNNAMNNRDWAGVVKTLNKEVTFFGSDKGEVSKDMAAFKETIKRQWDDYTTMHYGPVQDVYIELDDFANFGNIIYGVPFTAVSKDGAKEELFVIIQRTVKKDPINKNWVICSGILSIPRVASKSVAVLPNETK